MTTTRNTSIVTPNFAFRNMCNYAATFHTISLCSTAFCYILLSSAQNVTIEWVNLVVTVILNRESHLTWFKQVFVKLWALD